MASRLQSYCTRFGSPMYIHGTVQRFSIRTLNPKPWFRETPDIMLLLAKPLLRGMMPGLYTHIYIYISDVEMWVAM